MSDEARSGLAERAASIAQVLVSDIDVPVLDHSSSAHLSKSLRARNGERVSVVDGRGAWRMATWQDGVLRADGPVVTEPESAPVRVLFAVVKNERPDWAVQKLTELGVDHITLLTHTDRAVVRWDGERTNKGLERLARVAHEASMQSRRALLPLVDAVGRVDDVEGQFVMAHHEASDGIEAAGAVATGPEGGWSDRELGLGRPTVSLGQTVLRAETAALTAGVRLTASRAKSGVCPG